MGPDTAGARAELSQSSVLVAARLLGARVVSDIGGARVAVRLTEVEAYGGADDPASHGYRGRTVHNAVIFGPAGYLHCFFTYGLHWCSNVVSGEEGTSSAVLLRAGEVTEGLATARARRPSARKDSELARGPARLSVCLGLAGPADGLDLLSDASPVRLELQPAVSAGSVLSGPRVGISVAAGRPWRFWLAGDATVSAYKAGGRDSRRRQARS